MGPPKKVVGTKANKSSDAKKGASPKGKSDGKRDSKRSVTPIKPFSFKTDGLSDKERRTSGKGPSANSKSPGPAKSPKTGSLKDAGKGNSRAAEKASDDEEEVETSKAEVQKKSSKPVAKPQKASKSPSADRRRSDPKPFLAKRHRARPAVDYVLLAGRRRLSHDASAEPRSPSAAPAPKPGRKRPREEENDTEDDSEEEGGDAAAARGKGRPRKAPAPAKPAPPAKAAPPAPKLPPARRFWY